MRAVVVEVGTADVAPVLVLVLTGVDTELFNTC